MESGYVKSVTTDQVGRITFYHPAHNSLSGHLLQNLSDKIAELGSHVACHVIVLQSAGDRTFCAGASFDELSAIKNKEQGKSFFSGFGHVINTMRKCPKLIIGRVHGKTVGGGVGLIAATDYCFALKRASVKLSELSLGIGPFVIGPAVQRKIGLNAYSQLAISATDWHSADWGYQEGLFQQVFENIDDLDKNMEALLKKLVEYSPDAMSAFKKTLWEGTEDWDVLLEYRAEISGSLIVQDEARKAIAAIKHSQ